MNKIAPQIVEEIAPAINVRFVSWGVKTIGDCLANADESKIVGGMISKGVVIVEVFSVEFDTGDVTRDALGVEVG